MREGDGGSTGGRVAYVGEGLARNARGDRWRYGIKVLQKRERERGESVPGRERGSSNEGERQREGKWTRKD